MKDFKKYLPYVVAIVVFAVLTLVYFSPLLKGKELRQHDIAMHKGMSKEIVDFRKQHGTEPLWTNSMFGGMPAYQVSTLYPGNWLGALDNLFKLYLPHPGGYLFLYCLGFFILLLCLNVNPWLAIIGSVTYALSTYFLSIILAGHNSKANALGYLPALLGGIILLYRNRYWLGLAITALFTAMELNCNHVQIAYYGYMVIGFLILGYFIIALKNKQLPGFFKATAFLVIASLIGILPNAGNLMTTNEYGKLSNRGKAELTINPDMSSNKNVLSGGLDKDYATGWSYGISETFSFLIPDFKGGGNAAIGRVDADALKKVDPEYRETVSRSDAYFGDQPGLSAPDYIGAFIIVLAILGIFIVENPIKWPIVFVTCLTIPLGWGRNFMGLTSFFMDYVPGYNKFRAVSMIMIVAELTLPLLAMLAVDRLLKIKSWEEKVKVFSKELSIKKIIFYVTGAVAFFCILCFIAPGAVNTFHSQYEESELINEHIKAGYPEAQAQTQAKLMLNQIEIAREAMFKSDAGRSVIFIGLGFLLLFLYFTNRINRNITLASLGIFTLIDLYTVDQRYLNSKSFVTKAENEEYIAGKSLADEEILKDTDPDYRVLNLTVGPFDDASTSYYHKSVGGYHGAKLRRYVDLIDFHLRPEINYLYKNLSKTAASDSALNNLMASLNVLNMLNTRYFILPAGENGEKAVPLRNKQANGNAWFVKNIIPSASADSEIVTMRRINTKTEAVVNRKVFDENKLKGVYSGEGTVFLKSYAPNALEYESDSKDGGFVVFSEIYYAQGWNASIDGQAVPHFQVNYVLRGMQVPAGKHKIEFKFEPQTYKTGNTIALVGSILLLATIAAGLYMNRKKTVIVS